MPIPIITSGGDKAALLQSGQTGAMIFLSMNKGDTVTLTVNANYETVPSGNGFLGTAYDALFSSFDAAYGSGIENGVSSSSNVFDEALSGIDMSGKGNSSTAPRAFLNYIFFDQEMNYVSAGFLQTTTAAQGIGVHETISLNDIIADRKGYILAYLSNENAEEVAIHWDDFTVYHGKTNVMSASSYYPFGLQFGEYQRTKSKIQRYKYNNKEFLSETEWYDYGTRMYDPEISRWHVVDPAAEVFPDLTPFRYAFNNPINVVDRDGRIEVPLRGTYVVQKNGSEYLSNYPVFSRRRGWINQTGYFESSVLTDQYRSYSSNPDPNAIIRTSAWNIFRKSTEESPMTSPHIGTDFRASVGTNVYSLGDGKVIKVDPTSGNLVVEYENGDQVTFRHLSSIGDFSEGQSIYEGQVIAQTGKTRTRFAHLHVDAIDVNEISVNIEERNYGSVTNADFFNRFGGEYEKLKAYKEGVKNGTIKSYQQKDYSSEEWNDLLNNLMNN